VTSFHPIYNGLRLRAVYCPHPKDLKHGKIMLHGIGGKFHYRSYVEQIGHNNQIEYVCDRDYTLVGPAMATCVHRQWSPRVDRRCVLKTHPGTGLRYAASSRFTSAGDGSPAG